MDTKVDAITMDGINQLLDVALDALKAGESVDVVIASTKSNLRVMVGVALSVAKASALRDAQGVVKQVVADWTAEARIK